MDRPHMNIPPARMATHKSSASLNRSHSWAKRSTNSGADGVAALLPIDRHREYLVTSAGEQDLVTFDH
jgi:hypothetical protein